MLIFASREQANEFTLRETCLMIVTCKQLRIAAPRCCTGYQLHRLQKSPATPLVQALPAITRYQVRGKKTISEFRLEDDGIIPAERVAKQNGFEDADRAGGIEEEVPKKSRKRTTKPALGIDEATGLLQGLIPLEALPLEENIPSYPTVVLQARNNMRKFENCVLLTRVGGFYELYFEHADEFAPLLNLKVAQKKPGAKATWEPVSMVNVRYHVTSS